MTKIQYLNLCGAFRWALRRMPYHMALAWIAHWSNRDARIMELTYYWVK